MKLVGARSGGRCGRGAPRCATGCRFSAVTIFSAAIVRDPNGATGLNLPFPPIFERGRAPSHSAGYDGACRRMQAV